MAGFVSRLSPQPPNVPPLPDYAPSSDRAGDGIQNCGGPLTPELPGPTRDSFPLSAGRIRQLGWSIFRFAWRPIFGALALCVVPAYVLRLGVDAAVGNRIYEWLDAAASATQAGTEQPAKPSDFELGLLAIVLAAIVLFVASLIATAAVVIIVDRVYRGGAIGARAAVREALGRILSLLGAQLLMFVAVLVVVMIAILGAGSLFLGGGLLVFLGLVVLVGLVATILFIVVRASEMTVSIVVERKGAAEGFTRSWRLVADHGWRVLGYLILVGLLEVLLTALIAGVPRALSPFEFRSVADVALSAVIEGFAGILAGPIAPIVLTLLYYDLRWRHGERVPAAGGGDVAGLAQPDRR